MTDILDRQHFDHRPISKGAGLGIAAIISLLGWVAIAYVVLKISHLF